MKKILSLLLAAALTLSLAACGGPKDAPGGAEGSTLVYGSADYTRINPAMDRSRQ